MLYSIFANTGSGPPVAPVTLIATQAQGPVGVGVGVGVKVGAPVGVGVGVPIVVVGVGVGVGSVKFAETLTGNIARCPINLISKKYVPLPKLA